MNILFGAEFQERLGIHLSQANESVTILSAYIKETALKWLFSKLPTDINLDVTIVTRWAPQDLISGASDLSCYEFAHLKNWKFALDQSLHCKMFLIDSKELFLGSANLTQKGLHLIPNCNFEAGTRFDISKIDYDRLQKYICSCCYLFDDQFMEIKKYLDGIEISEGNIIEKWPNNILYQLKASPDFLWVNDMIPNEGENNFYNLKAYQWLINQIKKSENRYVNFGEITARLHDSLLDDPKPYRITVKQLVANLFEWIRLVNPPEIGIKKFNYTEAMFLK